MVKKGRFFDYSKIPHSIMTKHLKQIEDVYQEKKVKLNPKCSQPLVSRFNKMMREFTDNSRDYKKSRMVSYVFKPDSFRDFKNIISDCVLLT